MREPVAAVAAVVDDVAAERRAELPVARPALHQEGHPALLPVVLRAVRLVVQLRRRPVALPAVRRVVALVDAVAALPVVERLAVERLAVAEQRQRRRVHRPPPKTVSI